MDRFTNIYKPKAIFLDRDGTINVDRNYIYRITDFEFIPGVPEALKKLQDAGFKLIIITNQSGIARGYYTVQDYETLNNWMLSILAKEYDVYITASYYCPHLPPSYSDKGVGIIPEYKKDCNCRKPKIGLFEKAIKDFNIDPIGSYAIGDKIRDLAICESDGSGGAFGGIKGFLVGTKEDKSVIETVKRGELKAIRYAPNLLSAVKKILL